MESINKPGQKATNASFPAKTLQASSAVDGVVTDVTTVYFSDKIMVTISQGWRLAQWIQVPLLNTSPAYIPGSFPHEIEADESLLPMAHLTPKTLLGAGTSERETMGQLIATQIASVIKTRDPDEARTLVVGMGLKRINLDSGDEQRAAWMDLVDLVTGCL